MDPMEKYFFIPIAIAISFIAISLFMLVIKNLFF